MNNQYQSRDCCYFHPKQALVGVCPFCLNDKLLVVAAKQGRRNHLLHHRSRQESGSQSSNSRKAGNVGLPKIFALRSLLNRLELRHRSRRRSYDCNGGGSDYQSTSTSLEDSFISIKFGDNGVAFWDNSKVTKTSQDQSNKPWSAAATTATTTGTSEKLPTRDGSRKTNSNKIGVEHAKTPRGSLRWCKWIGHLLQLVRCKGSSKSSGGTTHVDGVGGVGKVKSKGWISTLTGRRTNKDNKG